MINIQLSEEKTKKKIQKRNGISIVNFIDKKSEISTCIRGFVSTLSPDIVSGFIWTSPEKYHITIVRCSSVERDIQYYNAFETYVNGMIKTKYPIILTPKMIRLDQDGVIRLYFEGEVDFGFNTTRLSQLSDKLKYTEIKKPWVTIAYSKLEYINYFDRNKTDILFSLHEHHIEYCISNISIVKFYDTGFCRTETIRTLKMSNSL